MELQRIVIVGASSGIGAALAVEMARPGRSLGLVARRATELHDIATAVTARGAKAVVRTCDAVDEAAVAECWHTLLGELGGCDALVYSSGVMTEVGPREFAIAKDRHIIEVNVIGAMAWLNLGAAHMADQGRGVLCGIGSVAGDRGRRQAPAYGASKAALHTYLESLRNRLSVLGVQVVTVKPGPVRTPMLGARKLPLTVSAEVAARRISRAIARGEHTVYVHWGYRWIMAIVRCIPSIVFRRLAI
ncbi:MAG: SDR family NAD(P)-dependent oxidoreductase [Deltaproteobacteria bacterium]|nr:SDR family NAD(P)-dependent oxidoreductase [Deltaproteobacteria bacterium]